ncbi:hypothetical protein ANO14919_023190 [Xylariales sp. No.14919]|nr:hypothetical protein ANO14919_023190 [Xylariales sp. No.14919]
MLTTLPPEIFSIIIEQLSKHDLKSLSAVSRHTRSLSAKTLWRSVVLRLVEGKMHCIQTASLPEQCYQLSTELHFRSYPESSVDCPHIYDEGSSIWGDDDIDDEIDFEDDDEYRDLPYFDRIAQRARLVLSRFADDQLRSFSWDLGTCIPPEILGSNGIVTLRQSRNLRSLHLITHPDCSGQWEDGDGIEIDLSSFRQLRSLGWKAPNAKNLEALSVALRSNSMHLQEFDLNLVDLEAARDMVGESGDDDYEGGSYDLGAILGMDERSPRPYFPEIRVLSLTQVPITPSMMAMADFSTLTSFTLRRCPGSAEFLGHIAEQTITINLQRLEFQSWENPLVESSRIRELIPTFAGLEELFILEHGPEDTIDLWDHIATNHATLRKFVYHQITSDLDEDSSYFEEFHDVQDLAIPLSISKVKKNLIKHNPFSRLDLKCLGLSCAPGKLLKLILRPFRTKNSLQLLHLRQTRRDMYRYECLGLRKRLLDNGGLMSLDCSLKGDMMDQAEALRGLRSRFRQFLEWAFGLNGLPSLQVVAFGDFAMSDAQYTVIACRDTNESTNFQIISPSHPKMRTILSEYGDVLRACPSESSSRTWHA